MPLLSGYDVRLVTSNKTNHLNLSALKAHDQIRQAFQLMSPPDQAIAIIRQNADRI